MNLFGRKPSVGHSKSTSTSTTNNHQVHLRTHQSGSKPTTVMISLEQIRETVVNLEKRQAFLTKKAQTHLEEAARLKTTNKPAALLALKRHKLMSAEVEKLINTQASLEAQMLSIESANITIGVVQSVQVGATAQKQLQKNMDPEAIAQLQEDVSEHVDMVDEVNKTLGMQLGDPFDDDELSRQLDELTVTPTRQASPSTSNVSASLVDDDELNKLESEILSSLPVAPQFAPLPAAPKTALLSPHSTSASQDDEELMRLAKEMES